MFATGSWYLGVSISHRKTNMSTSQDARFFHFVRYDVPGIKNKPIGSTYGIWTYFCLMFMQVAWKPVPFLSVLQICVTNARAGFIAICSISYTFSVLFTDMQTLKFSSQICDQKKSSNFQNMHFVRVSCTFCQKIVQIVFSFSTCQIVRVGWGEGW